MWGLIWDQDVEISINAIWILLLIDSMYEIERFEVQNYKAVV